MHYKIVLLPLFSALICIPTSAREIYKDDKTTVDLRGYLTISYVGSEDTDEFTDSGSRVGFSVMRKIQQGWEVGITAEWATNFEQNENITFNQGGDNNGPSGSADDNFASRHGFVTLQHDDWGTFTLGKQWGVFYDVTWGTDVLNFFGGNAAGSFNANTDGGISGTGRAEQAMIWRKSYGDFDFGLQFQAQDEPVILTSADETLNGLKVATVGNGFGLSTTYNVGDFSFSAGYNETEIDLEDLFEPTLGQDTEDSITGLAIRYGEYRGQGFYGSLVWSSSENHETDNEGNFFHANGTEFVLWYTHELYSFYGGLNHLDPKRKSNDYQLYYQFLGAEYHFIDDIGHLFVEVKFNDTTLRDNSKVDGTDIVLGVRIDL
ncbi:porin [Thalassotalea aquiviva]|uniref:porin n=1 Tax=Thalassotalea aquiviva TaxID=3242415 RepID=UPI00352ACE54